jgi:cytochrome c oxidase subunit 2
MKMSSGQIGRRLLRLAVAGMTLVSGGMALAAQPQPWEMTLQPAASPVMENIISFHNLLLVLITIITLFVLVLLVIVVVKFNAKTNPVPSRTTHNTLIEVAWTLIPVLILVGIAVPSFRLLFQQLDIPKADLTVKATGKQWYWSYSYPDNGKFEFDSLLAQDKQPRLLGVDNEMVVPVNKVIRVQTTGADVIHAFAVPSFKLLFLQLNIPAADVTVKATGKQWYWTYNYPDGKFEFDSLMLQDADRKKIQPEPPRLLGVDNEMVVPVNKVIRIQTTGADVIHSIAVPAFGIKIDSIPGRLNETWFKATKVGMYYGQCSELCGKDHVFMPIAVRVVEDQEFATWVEAAKKKFATNPANTFASAGQAAAQ